MDGLLLSIFDRLRESAMVGCCDDPACDLHACLHQMIIGALLTVRIAARPCFCPWFAHVLPPMQLDLPYPEVKSQCMALLGSEVPILEGAFLNFALDALLVSLIGTTARDFQLAVSHFGDLPAVYDADLAVRRHSRLVFLFIWEPCRAVAVCDSGHVRPRILHTTSPAVERS